MAPRCLVSDVVQIPYQALESNEPTRPRFNWDGWGAVSQGRSDSIDCRSAGTVGAMLRCFRERRLWTQATLAERAGLPEKTISSLETGARRRPHLTTLELLADALELDV